MSLHSIYCSVCHKSVEVELAGRPHDFMSWEIRCPCENDESVVIKNISCYEYALFNICDLVPSVEIIQEVLKSQGK